MQVIQPPWRVVRGADLAAQRPHRPAPVSLKRGSVQKHAAASASARPATHLVEAHELVGSVVGRSVEGGAVEGHGAVEDELSELPPEWGGREGGWVWVGAVRQRTRTWRHAKAGVHRGACRRGRAAGGGGGATPRCTGPRPPRQAQLMSWQQGMPYSARGDGHAQQRPRRRSARRRQIRACTDCSWTQLPSSPLPRVHLSHPYHFRCLFALEESLKTGFEGVPQVRGKTIFYSTFTFSPGDFASMTSDASGAVGAKIAIKMRGRWQTLASTFAGHPCPP